MQVNRSGGGGEASAKDAEMIDYKPEPDTPTEAAGGRAAIDGDDPAFGDWNDANLDHEED